MRIWLSKPHMGGAEEKYVAEAFESNFVAPAGPQLNAFEARFAEYLGEGVHCLGLASGSAALHLALHMLELSRGDQVWVSSMTFAGGVFPIVYEGATPVFFDLDPGSWTISPDLLAEELARAAKENRLPRAIVPTDLYGQSCDLDRIEQIAAEYDVPVIVDSAESAGSCYRDRKAGTGGDMSILSFNGNKIITTSGGGMLVSRDVKWIEKARFLATQARDSAPHYQHSEYGFNYRLSNICAAIGLGQLEVLDERVRQRRAVFACYQEKLGAIDGVTFMPEPDWSTSTHWLTTLMLNPTKCSATREDVRLALQDQEIESRPLWKPMHMQPLFKGARYVGSGFDEQLFRDGLCLPSNSDLAPAEQDEVIQAVGQVLGLC